MTYKTHNQISIDIDGTSLQGYINSNYGTLVELFGHPTESDGYKVDWEWELRFEDGTVATIYNWKNGPNYCGRDGLQCDQVTEWHIGGHVRNALYYVQEVLKSRAIGGAA
jgi:hypothetical protein